MNRRGRRLPCLLEGNEVLKIRIKFLSAAAKVPTRAHDGDAGWDLYSAENVDISPDETRVVATGIAVAIPCGWYGQIKVRSSHGRSGVIVTAGVIDSSYRGGIGVAMVNFSHDPLRIKAGDRIAQIVFLPVPNVRWKVVKKNLPGTSRNGNGWGSTGNR